jgi:hypothetical protein
MPRQLVQIARRRSSAAVGCAASASAGGKGERRPAAPRPAVSRSSLPSWRDGRDRRDQVQRRGEVGGVAAGAGGAAAGEREAADERQHGGESGLSMAGTLASGARPRIVPSYEAGPRAGW